MTIVTFWICFSLAFTFREVTDEELLHSCILAYFVANPMFPHVLQEQNPVVLHVKQVSHHHRTCARTFFALCHLIPDEAPRPTCSDRHA